MADISNQTDRKYEKVISGEVKVKNRITPKKIIQTFFTEDLEDVKTHVVFDILIPKVKDAVVDSILNTIEMIFYGEVRRRTTVATNTSPIRTISYDKMSKKSETSPSRPTPGPRRGFHPEDYVFESSADAQKVLDMMCDVLEQYGSVSASDFCEFAGVSCEYTLQNYGWRDLSDAKIARAGGGLWVIDLPAVRPLK